MTEFMIRFNGSKYTPFFLRLVYYPLWKYWQNFDQATWWRDGIIIDPNHYYGHIILYSSLHDRIYDPIQWFQKYSVFPPARGLPSLAILAKFRTGHEVAWRHIYWSESFLWSYNMVWQSPWPNLWSDSVVPKILSFSSGSCTTPFGNTGKISNGPRGGVTA